MGKEIKARKFFVWMHLFDVLTEVTFLITVFLWPDSRNALHFAHAKFTDCNLSYLNFSNRSVDSLFLNDHQIQPLEIKTGSYSRIPLVRHTIFEEKRLRDELVTFYLYVCYN